MGFGGGYSGGADANLVLSNLSDIAAARSNLGLDGGMAILFDKTYAQSVNHGVFFPEPSPSTDFKQCFWDAWIKPVATVAGWTGYIVAAGYGGGHPVLIGVTCSPAGDCYISGNKWINAAFVSYSADRDTFKAGTWNYVAVAYDGEESSTGKFIYVYLNHVLALKVPANGKRTTLGKSSSVLYIGGTHHNTNFNGYIAKVRGFEGGVLPFSTGLLPEAAFRPDSPGQQFRTAFQNSTGITKPASFMADYTFGNLNDLSSGFDGGAGGALYPHHGALESDASESASDIGAFEARQFEQQNPPIFVYQPITRPAYGGTVESIPGDSIVFDDFSREDSVFTWSSYTDKVALGTARTGQAWTHAADAFGILSGAAYCATVAISVGVIEAAQADYSVILTRKGTANNYPRAVVRYADSSNYIFVAINAASPTSANLLKKVGGVQTNVANLTGLTTTWTEMRVDCIGDTITVYFDGVLKATETIADGNTNTKVGMESSLSGNSYYFRVDKFDVKPL